MRAWGCVGVGCRGSGEKGGAQEMERRVELVRRAERVERLGIRR